MGSTAVPGLPSKPIIDLLVEVPSLEEAKKRCIGALEGLGDKRPELVVIGGDAGDCPHALAFGQLRDRRLKALLGMLACRYLKPLTVIVSDPHTVLVDPTVLDFANAFCCHQRRGALGLSTGHGGEPGPALGTLPVVLQPCDDNHVIEGTGYPVTDIGIPCALYLIAGLLLLIWFALCWIIGTPSRFLACNRTCTAAPCAAPSVYRLACPL
jgi:hypothetical protein